MVMATFARSNVRSTIPFLLETKHTNGFLIQVQNSYTAVKVFMKRKFLLHYVKELREFCSLKT